MPDRVERLREAAQARHEATLRRAKNALQSMTRRGEPVTFRRVAETAGVSRSWLYRQQELRDEINRLRHASQGRPGVLPSAERATADSLRQQVRTYRDEAVLMVIQTQRPIAQVARELGVNEGTLGTWVSKYRNEHPVTEELSLPDRAKLKELELSLIHI